MANNKKELPIDELIKLYIDEEKSLSYIGKQYQVAPDTIKTRLIEHGIVMRDVHSWIRGKKEPENRRLARSKALKGHTVTEKQKTKQSNTIRGKIEDGSWKPWGKGLTKFEDGRLAKCGSRKEEHWNWQGGVSELSNLIRNSHFVKQWKRKCLERDNFTCQKCGDIENLKVHHIIYFSKIMENISSFEEAEQDSLMNDVDNGITLCHKCHSEIHINESISYIQQYNRMKKKGS